MLGDGVSMAIASIWASMANWSTPTVLFCVLNLMIATIFIASNFKSPNHHHHHQNNTNTNPSQLARSPSLLDRVKSVNLSSFYTTPESHDHQYRGHSETTASNPVSQLSHPTSLLQRVKSIDFSFASFHNSFTTESERINPTSELTRAPSLLDRVKSFKLTSPFTSDHHSAETFSNVDEHSDMDPHQDLPDLSETSGETPARNLLKSRSDRRAVASDGGEEHVDQRRSASMKAAVGVHDECVDTKAEDFIKRFKQQLKLQRIDSLQRLKEMLNRGTSSA